MQDSIGATVRNGSGSNRTAVGGTEAVGRVTVGSNSDTEIRDREGLRRRLPGRQGHFHVAFATLRCLAR